MSTERDDQTSPEQKKEEKPSKTGTKAKIRKGMILLSEETVRREGFSEEINPYWAMEEAEPHPDPSKGCVRRGLCCKSSPGWFAPGELEIAAASLDMDPGDFVRTYTVVDWIELEGERVDVFVPAKLGVDDEPLYPLAHRVDRLYKLLRGRCIFFKDNGCSIHGAHPLECRRYICTNVMEDNLSHPVMARMWRDGLTEEEATQADAAARLAASKI